MGLFIFAYSYIRFLLNNSIIKSDKVIRLFWNRKTVFTERIDPTIYQEVTHSSEKIAIVFCLIWMRNLKNQF